MSVPAAAPVEASVSVKLRSGVERASTAHTCRVVVVPEQGEQLAAHETVEARPAMPVRV